ERSGESQRPVRHISFYPFPDDSKRVFGRVRRGFYPNISTLLFRPCRRLPYRRMEGNICSLSVFFPNTEDEDLLQDFLSFLLCDTIEDTFIGRRAGGLQDKQTWEYRIHDRNDRIFWLDRTTWRHAAAKSALYSTGETAVRSGRGACQKPED